MFKLLILASVCLLVAESGLVEAPFSTFNGLYPNSRYNVGKLLLNSLFRATLNCTELIESTSIQLFTIDDVIINNTNKKVDPYTTVLQMNIPKGTFYWVYLFGYSYYLSCTLKLELSGGTIIANVELNNFPLTPIHRIEVDGPCKIRLNYTGLPLGTVYAYDLQGIRDTQEPFATITKLPYDLTLPASGEFFITLEQATLNLSKVNPFTMDMITYCSEQCIVPNNEASFLACSKCGDAILDRGE